MTDRLEEEILEQKITIQHLKAKIDVLAADVAISEAVLKRLIELREPNPETLK